MPFSDEHGAWEDGLRRLAALDQVAIKISGFGITDHGWTVESIRGYVLTAIDIFGTGRVMFASDFPTDKLHATYGRCLSAYADIIAPFTTDEQLAMWGMNASRLYRFEA